MHRPGSLITSMLHDATLPVFLVMGIASIASVLTNVSCLSLSPSASPSLSTTFHWVDNASSPDSLVKTKALMEFTDEINDHLHQQDGLKTSWKFWETFKRPSKSISTSKMKSLTIWMNQWRENSKWNRKTKSRRNHYKFKTAKQAQRKDHSSPVSASPGFARNCLYSSLIYLFQLDCVNASAISVFIGRFSEFFSLPLSLSLTVKWSFHRAKRCDLFNFKFIHSSHHLREELFTLLSIDRVHA